jgi:hypothetical protein
MVVGFMLSMVLGFGAVLVAEKLDTSFHSVAWMSCGPPSLSRRCSAFHGF